MHLLQRLVLFCFKLALLQSFVFALSFAVLICFFFPLRETAFAECGIIARIQPRKAVCFITQLQSAFGALIKCDFSLSILVLHPLQCDLQRKNLGLSFVMITLRCTRATLWLYQSWKARFCECETSVLFESFLFSPKFCKWNERTRDRQRRVI